MPSPTGGYVALLRSSGAGSAFAAATILRLSYGTVGLALLLTVAQATGSFAVAGISIAALIVPSLLLPLKSRAVDAVGRRTVLLLLAPPYALVVLAVAAAARAGVTQAGYYVSLAALAGLLTPPVGPVMRAIWARATSDGGPRQRAYALDTVVEESTFALGPVFVAVTAGAAGPDGALALAGGLALVGGLALAFPERGSVAAGPARPGQRPDRTAVGDRSVLPALTRLLFMMFVAGALLGSIEVAVPARAATDGNAATAGYLLGALSVGSALGGLAWGRVPRRGSVPILLAFVVVGTVLTGLFSGHLVTVVVLGLTGLVVAPLFVTAYLDADALVPAHRRTEAGTWVSTASNVGGAGGSALAGVLASAGGPGTALLIVAGVSGVIALTLVGTSRVGTRE